METWPNFFIIGAPRAGTTTLYDYLARTNGIYMSSRKEPHYFSTIDSSYLYPIPIRSKKKYLSLFDGVKNETAIGEASTSYLWDPKTPKLIHQVVPKAKIIIILRDPVERAYSHYLLRLSGGKKFSFREAIKRALESNNDYYNTLVVNGGLYSKQVKRYLNVFGSSQVKVLIFEEFIKEPKKTVREVLQFLGVDSEPPEPVELVHNYLTKPRGKVSASILKNKILRKTGKVLLPESAAEVMVKKVFGKKIIKPPMSTKDKIFLKKLYKDDVKDLQIILKRKLPWDLVND